MSTELSDMSDKLDDQAPWDDPPEEPTSEADLDFPAPAEKEKTDLPQSSGRSTGDAVGVAHLEALKTLIADGRKGEAAWIPLALPRLGQHVQIAQKRYYLLGGASGTGKTALGHQLFILAPYAWYRKNAILTQETDVKLKIIVRNMERPTPVLIGKWACLYLQQKYGILMDVTSLLGYGQQKSRVTDEVFEKVTEALDYFEEMLDVVQIIPGSENPTGIWNHLKRVAEEDGQVKQITKYVKAYKPHNDKQITLVMLDHIGRISVERGFDERINLKKMSEYLSIVRDLYGFSPVVINQFNRGLQETGRRGFIEPEERDFKGASNMYEDTDFAMALFNPLKYGKKEHAGYQCHKLVSATGVNRFRSLHILKNSYGMDDFQVGMRFIGEVGHFDELAQPQSIGDRDYRALANLEI